MRRKNEILNLEGQVSHLKDDVHFIETLDGCFIWQKDKNSLEETEKDYAEVCESYSVENGKNLGNFSLKDLCGDNVRFIDSHYH